MLHMWPVAFVVAAAAAPVAGAQGTDCETAALRVGVASLPRAGSAEWNDWVTLTGCGSRGATVIGAALRSAGVRQEGELTRLDQMAGLLDGWFQPSLVAAYEWLLRAPDASNAIRLRAMWLLAGLYAPDVEVAGPLQGFMTARCERYDRTTTLREAPTTLPGEAYDRAADAVAFVAADRSAPDYVRTTAQCWDGVIQGALAAGNIEGTDVAGDAVAARQTVVISQPTVVVERPVRVVYDCGTRFIFYNDAVADLAIRYDGYGAGVLRVRRGGPFVWVAARFGPMRFWLGDQEVVYTSAVYRPCGASMVRYPAVLPWRDWRPGLGVFIGARIVRPPVYVAPRVIVTRPARPSRPVIIRRGDTPGPGRNWPEPRGGRAAEPPRGGRTAEPSRAPEPPRVAVPKVAPDGPRSGGVSRQGGYTPRGDRGSRAGGPPPAGRGGSRGRSG